MTELIGNKTLKASGDYSELNSIREFIKTQALKAGLGDKKANEVTLAVDEACSNLIRYGVKFNIDESIKIKAYTENKNFIIMIMDRSTPFDPSISPSPDMSSYFKRLKKGGLGIHIMKQIVDKLEYSPSSQNNPDNVLTLTMKL